jgi:hypothetical protein
MLMIQIKIFGGKEVSKGIYMLTLKIQYLLVHNIHHSRCFGIRVENWH